MTDLQTHPHHRETIIKTPEDARQGLIVMHKPWHRAVFLGGIFALVAAGTIAVALFGRY